MIKNENNHVFRALVIGKNTDTDKWTANGQELTENPSGMVALFSDSEDKVVTEIDNKDFYFAQTLDNNNDGEIDEVLYSTGSRGGNFKAKDVIELTAKGYVAPKPQITDITGIKTQCSTEYSLKIEIENQEKYRLQGYVPYSATYSAMSGTCNECTSCGKGGCNTMVKALIEDINKDKHMPVKAEPIDKEGNVITDWDAFIEQNKTVNEDDDTTNDVCAGIRLTSQPVKKSENGNQMINNIYPRQTTFVVATEEGFDCEVKVETTQKAVMEQGAGHDVRQREYIAGGEDGRPGPYRIYNDAAMFMTGFKYLTNETEKYATFVITHNIMATGGWLEYNNIMSTEIYVPISMPKAIDYFKGIFEKLAEKAGLDNPVEDFVLEA